MVFDVTKKASCPELIWQIVYIQGDPNTTAPTYHSNIAADWQAKNFFTNSKKPSSSVGNNVTHDLSLNMSRTIFGTASRSRTIRTLLSGTTISPNTGYQQCGGDEWLGWE